MKCTQHNTGLAGALLETWMPSIGRKSKPCLSHRSHKGKPAGCCPWPPLEKKRSMFLRQKAGSIVLQEEHLAGEFLQDTAKRLLGDVSVVEC